MLKGKIAFITGAARGIGRETAITLAEYGAFVIINYNGSKEQAESLVEEIEKKGGHAKCIQGSVGDFSQCESMIGEVLKEYGRIDILVNNAGITKDNLMIKMTEKDFDDVINVNLKGCFNIAKCMYRAFLKQKSGRIINLTSVSGISGNAGQANYAASKAGVIGLTKSLAKELASRSVTVNAVAPGYIDTEMTQKLSDGVKEGILTQIPLSRVGKTREVAELIAFLASERAAYITGQVIAVDGGMIM